MFLRKLKLVDAPFMVEWMHDKNVVEFLFSSFAEKNIRDCEQFILSSWSITTDLHMAIASSADEYMGTVSLKHIDKENNNAEFAIIVRKTSMGKGYSWFGMTEMLRIAFEEMKLSSLYWCVSAKNGRALEFYSKHGFREGLGVPDTVHARYNDAKHFKWYILTSEDYFSNETIFRDKVAGCKVLKIKTVTAHNAGALSFFEASRDLPFEVKRFYYISKVPGGVKRGFHAHKQLKQFIFSPYGRIQLVLDDGSKREKIILRKPTTGILIESPVWREMLWLKKDSVLCIAASDYFTEEDYIRDYDAFLSYVNLGGAK